MIDMFCKHLFEGDLKSSINKLNLFTIEMFSSCLKSRYKQSQSLFGFTCRL